jgi:hypothetical protein
MNRIPPGKPLDDGKLVPLTASKDRETVAVKDAKILARARKRFDICVDKESENRKEGLLDDKFLSGQQWPADIQAQRNSDQRPCLTVNKLPTFVNQVTNEQRIDRPSINISPIGDRADVEVAKMLRGLIRFFERESHADDAYDTAFASSASKGWGYWRTVTEFISPETFDQTIVVKRILNAFSVYLDPGGTEPDGADARYGFVTDLIPRSEFEEQYPDADPMSWTESGAGDTFKNWVDDKNVRIAEYYEIEYEDRALVALSNGHLGWRDELDPGVLADIESGKLDVLDERDSECPKVKWYKITAVEILERRDWPGRWIPITKVIGNEINIEGKTQYSGVVRGARDAQRIYNYSKTAQMEVVALAPKAHYIMAEGQEEGHEDEWRQANTKSFSYLTYKPMSLNGQPLPPPTRQQPVQPSAGWDSLIQGSAQDMMATTGIRFDATLQERMVDESGRALREIKRTTDVTTFHYQDNLGRSLKHQGDIFIDLITNGKVLDTKRVVTILREDDTEEQVTLDPKADKPYQEQRNAATGKTMKIFNPVLGKYGVRVTIGPSFATKRIEAAESMMDFVRALPESAPFISDLVAKNQDWPQAEQISARLAKMLPPQLLAPDMKDVPPQVQALIQQGQAHVQQLTQQLQVAAKALADKDADRQIEMTKINNDFEAKLLNVVANVETKMAATQEKAVANFNTHIGAQIKELGTGVTTLMQQMEKGQQQSAEQAAQAMPPEAAQHLQEGQTTHFANGKRYTLSGGQPLEVAGGG